MTFTREQLFSGNANLLRLADYVEQRQSAMGRPSYDQRRLYTSNGPGCLLGHKNAMYRGDRVFPGKEIYALTASEESDLFSFDGCDNAGTNWRKAVAYVREFVRKRQAAMGPRP